ncbi:hypothetical protein ABFY60_01030 [Lysinibacillus pakistanensis]|uniref:hypothetical protein n=1 Tax=Lysinibacillus pakistanensis TaxID=759811 RepID=UPI003D2BC604
MIFDIVVTHQTLKMNYLTLSTSNQRSIYIANISSFKWKYDGYANNIVISFEFTYHITPQKKRL